MSVAKIPHEPIADHDEPRATSATVDGCALSPIGDRWQWNGAGPYAVPCAPGLRQSETELLPVGSALPSRRRTVWIGGVHYDDELSRSNSSAERNGNR